MTWWQLVLTVVGQVVITAGTVYVARLTGKSAKQAADTTADAAREANAIDGFNLLTDQLQEQVGALREDVTSLKARQGDLEREVRLLRDERRKHRSLIRRLWERLQAALREIDRLHGTPPPDVYHDAEMVRLILDADSP